MADKKPEENVFGRAEKLFAKIKDPEKQTDAGAYAYGLGNAQIVNARDIYLNGELKGGELDKFKKMSARQQDEYIYRKGFEMSRANAEKYINQYSIDVMGLIDPAYQKLLQDAQKVAADEKADPEKRKNALNLLESMPLIMQQQLRIDTDDLLKGLTSGTVDEKTLTEFNGQIQRGYMSLHQKGYLKQITDSDSLKMADDLDKQLKGIINTPLFKSRSFAKEGRANLWDQYQSSIKQYGLEAGKKQFIKTLKANNLTL